MPYFLSASRPPRTQWCALFNNLAVAQDMEKTEREELERKRQSEETDLKVRQRDLKVSHSGTHRYTARYHRTSLCLHATRCARGRKELTVTHRNVCSWFGRLALTFFLIFVLVFEKDVHVWRKSDACVEHNVIGALLSRGWLI